MCVQEQLPSLGLWHTRSLLPYWLWKWPASALTPSPLWLPRWYPTRWLVRSTVHLSTTAYPLLNSSRTCHLSSALVQSELTICLQAPPCYDLKWNCIFLEMTRFWGETSRQWWLDSKLFSSWTLSYRLANVQIKQFVIPAGVVLERTETLASLKHILNDSADNEFPVVDSHGESNEYCITSSTTQLHLFDFNGTLLLDRREWKPMKCVPIRAKGQMIACWWVETIKTAPSR